MNPRYRTAAVALMLGLAVLASGPASEGQILRPEGASDTQILVIERVIRMTLDLPVEAEIAFDAWTEATRLVEWLPHWAEMTVAEGESYSFGWDGYEGEWSGTYLEVERPERLSFTWVPPEGVFPSGQRETVVTLTFEETDEGRTSMTLEHSGFGEVGELESQLQAWRGYMFALRAYLLRSASQ